jgi:hypothetical protein
MKKTTAPKQQTEKKNIFALTPADLKAIHGGKGVIAGGPEPVEKQP